MLKWKPDLKITWMLEPSDKDFDITMIKMLTGLGGRKTTHNEQRGVSVERRKL